MPSENLTIKLPPDLREAARAAAQARHLSLSAWIRLAMLEALKGGKS